MNRRHARVVGLGRASLVMIVGIVNSSIVGSQLLAQSTALQHAEPCALVHDSIPAHTLEFSQIRVLPLPTEFRLAGAAISPAGSRVVAWSTDPPIFLLGDVNSGSTRLLSTAPPVAGATFVTPDSIELITPSGSIAIFDWPSATLTSSDAFGLRDSLQLTGARRAPRGWWLLDRTDEPSSSRLLFATADRAVLDPQQLLSVAAAPERLFLSTAGDDALLTLRTAPFTFWRISHDGEIVNTVQLDPTSRATMLPDYSTANKSRTWFALSTFLLRDTYLQLIADIQSDRRILVSYDGEGNLLSHHAVDAPFGVVDVARAVDIALVVRTFTSSELVFYSIDAAKQVHC